MSTRVGVHAHVHTCIRPRVRHRGVAGTFCGALMLAQRTTRGSWVRCAVGGQWGLGSLGPSASTAATQTPRPPSLLRSSLASLLPCLQVGAHHPREPGQGARHLLPGPCPSSCCCHGVSSVRDPLPALIAKGQQGGCPECLFFRVPPSTEREPSPRTGRADGCKRKPC